MSEQIIGMDDMMAVYEVTDLFGIDRETISVPLEREGQGSVSRVARTEASRSRSPPRPPRGTGCQP